MNDTISIMNSLVGLLGSNTVTPMDYHRQVRAVKKMLRNDFTGTISSLTDFQVHSASVDFTIGTDRNELTKIFKKWTELINIEYNGKVPTGLNAVAEEYFKERWQASSFPVLKIMKWEEIDGIMLPTKMAFVDGEVIHAFDKASDSSIRIADSYDYYVGKKQEASAKLDKDVIFNKSEGRWYDKYPTPYLIKRGVYHNYAIIDSLKGHQIKTLDQLIPYILLIKKGNEALLNRNISYNEEKLNGVITDFQKLVDKLQTVSDSTPKGAIRATQFDEDISHIIPDLGTIFKTELFAVTERNILSGLGFIDIAEGVSDSRRESILNPKAFISEVKKGIKDFKQVITQLLYLIKTHPQNLRNTKYMNTEVYIDSTAVHPFLNDKSMNQIRLLWERGQVSNKTYSEVVGELNYESEVHRRKVEAENGTEDIMKPHSIRAEELMAPAEQEEKEDDKNGQPLPDDKVEENQKNDYSNL